MRFNDQQFASSLQRIVSVVEENANVSLVVAVSKASDSFRSFSLYGGLVVSFIVGLIASLLNVPAWISLVGISLSFAVSYLIVEVFPALKRLLVGRRRLVARAEESARAYFQFANIYETPSRNGVLIYFSVLEETVHIFADKHARPMLTDELWLQIHQSFESIYQEPNSADALINQLMRIGPLFPKYMPKKKSTTHLKKKHRGGVAPKQGSSKKTIRQQTKKAVKKSKKARR